jgi:hypothetical protein
MINDPVKLVTPQRVEQLLDCYGGSPQAWPEEERAAALALLESSTELQRLRKEALILDRAMNLTEAAAPTAEPTADLAQKILGQLPAQDSAHQPNHVGRHKPGQDQRRPYSRITLFNRIWVWPGVAVCGAAAVALAIALWSPQPVIEPKYRLTTAANDFDDWVWEEVLDQTPEYPISPWDSGLVTLLDPELVLGDF